MTGPVHSLEVPFAGLLNGQPSFVTHFLGMGGEATGDTNTLLLLLVSKDDSEFVRSTHVNSTFACT